MWLFLIGNGAEIRPLEMGRKGPVIKSTSVTIQVTTKAMLIM